MMVFFCFKLGPRLCLQLIKIEEGLCSGEVLFHELGENYIIMGHKFMVFLHMMALLKIDNYLFKP